MAAAKPVTLVFERETETKNKIRFQEMEPVVKGGKPQATDSKKAVVGKLYVNKKKLKEMGDPETLHVTIAAP